VTRVEFELLPKVTFFPGVQSADGFLDIAVASVEVALRWLSVLSIELRVDAILCFEGVLRRKLEGREGAATPRLEVGDVTFAAEFEPVQKRPRNRDAAACTFGRELNMAVESPVLASLNVLSSFSSPSRVTSPVSPTKSLTRSSALHPYVSHSALESRRPITSSNSMQAMIFFSFLRISDSATRISVSEAPSVKMTS
jgi:hypothetical protein